ncbi:hypothetical protein ACTOWA_13720 [Herbaspirillum seropedicae]|uniref:hypothetical protein n=1 Tax=Herbaspirillum seropedicae TaxID=964 RepID=UPI003F8D3FEE
MNKYYWEISQSPYKSPFLESAVDFGSKPDVTLIDLYSGKQPSIIDEAFITSGKRQFKIFPSALLDSNLADELVRLANGDNVSEGFLKFFTFLTEKRWDLSLLFYYVEHFAKSGKSDNFFDNATRRTEALLKLQSMNEERWLQSGEIVESHEAVAHYLNIESATSIEDAARKRVTRFADRFSVNSMKNMIRATEIALAKMVLLRRFDGKTLSSVEQWAKYKDFLRNELGVFMGREALLALHYFNDLAGKLLGTQSNTRWDAACKNIRSTAWDLYFLRFADQMFEWDGQLLILPYPATNERALANFAKLTKIERLIPTASNNLTPVVSYDLSLLGDKRPPGDIDMGTGRGTPVVVEDSLYESTVGRLSGLLQA